MKCKLSFVRNYEKGSKDDSDIVYDIVNQRELEIGDICYSHKWRTWIFNADIGAFFDVTCLQQIIDELNRLNKLKSSVFKE